MLLTNNQDEYYYIAYKTHTTGSVISCPLDQNLSQGIQIYTFFALLQIASQVYKDCKCFYKIAKCADSVILKTGEPEKLLTNKVQLVEPISFGFVLKPQTEYYCIWDDHIDWDFKSGSKIMEVPFKDVSTGGFATVVPIPIQDMLACSNTVPSKDVSTCGSATVVPFLKPTINSLYKVVTFSGLIKYLIKKDTLKLHIYRCKIYVNPEQPTTEENTNIQYPSDTIVLRTGDEKDEAYTNKIEVLNKLDLSTDKIICTHLLEKHPKFFVKKSGYFSRSIINFSMVKQMIKTEPSTIFDYTGDPDFWSENMLVLAIQKAFELYETKCANKFFKEIYSKYKTNSLCLQVLTTNQELLTKLIKLIPSELKTQDFYTRVFIKYVSECKRSYQYTLLIEELPEDVEIWESLWKACEMLGKDKPHCRTKQYGNQYNGDDVKCAHWLYTHSSDTKLGDKYKHMGWTRNDSCVIC